MNIPVLVRLLIVFVGMLALNRLGLPLGVALLFGGMTIDLWSDGSLGHDLAGALTQSDLWLLLAVTALLLEFGRSIGKEHNERAILSAAQKWGGRHGRALSLMIIPAVIGLIPMPGGALVSAPLVDKAVTGKDWSSDWKSAVNYWFRHIWEYWWPLFPVVIVTLSIFHVSTIHYTLTLIPFSITSIAAGYFFLVRPHLNRLAQEKIQNDEGHDFRPLIGSLLVILVCVLFVPLLLRMVCPALSPQTNKMVAMLIGMASGLVILLFHEAKFGRPQVFAGFFTYKSFNQLVTLGGVVVFQYFLEASKLMPQAASELAHSGIPVKGVVALLPFIAGLTTGVASGFAGLAFPLIVGLMESGETTLTPLATLALAFGFGYVGMLLSPVHLCLILTRDYFEAKLAFIYRHILPCVLVTTITAIVLHWLLSALGL